MANMINVVFDYEWLPFTVAKRPFCFAHKSTTRLEQGLCSHWGPAIYKWQCTIATGPFRGKVGILIGETDDLRSRINQYATGTQPTGNLYWRRELLECGEALLFTLNCKRFELVNGVSVSVPTLMRSKNTRLILEQLLILRESYPVDERKWIVNKGTIGEF